MKKPLFLLLIIISCSKSPTEYICYSGNNNFTPTIPILPHLSSSITYTFLLYDEWLGPLTNSRAHGCKMPAIGGPSTDYHDNGANFGIMYRDDHLTLHARYYKNGKMYVLPEVPIETNVTYTVIIQLKPLKWFLDGKLLAEVDSSLQTGWLTPSYIGKKDFAVANRNLRLLIGYQ